MNTIVLIGLMVGSSSASDMALDYKKCVEEFAISQIRSGESAEILVQVGEAECAGRLVDIEQAVRAEIQAMPSTRDGYEGLSKEDVDKLIEDSVNDRMSTYTKLSHDAALRNVVFFKARVNEIESK